MEQIKTKPAKPNFRVDMWDEENGQEIVECNTVAEVWDAIDRGMPNGGTYEVKSPTGQSVAEFN